MTPTHVPKGSTAHRVKLAAAVALTVAAVPSLYAQGRVGPQTVAPIAEKLIDAETARLAEGQDGSAR